MHFKKGKQNMTPNTTYQNFVQSHRETAEKCIPLRPKIKRTAQENKKLRLKRENLKRIAKQNHTYSTTPT